MCLRRPLTRICHRGLGAAVVRTGLLAPGRRCALAAGAGHESRFWHSVGPRRSGTWSRSSIPCFALMSAKPIFSVESLTKSYQNKKPVLNDVNLVFLQGAKIGVIGQNGAGKSTLLRIMSGQDTEFDGVARLADGKTVGYVPQEPTLL
ncbi:MAG TPA: ATP-binding cassette domain-containing protein, partial [Planctomycetes bacterium]|nr:ATP-binding cassette domain-containing protein [Planctomycetota bacterium]